MRNLLLYIIVLLLASSCFIKINKQAKNKGEAMGFVSTYGIQPTLYDTIMTYIRKNDIRINGEPILYYTVYSVASDSGTLVTLWKSSSFPNYIQRQNNVLSFYLYKVHDRNVILVSDNCLDNYLFDKSAVRQRRAIALSKKKLLKYYYDGNWNMVSFLIQSKGSGILMKPTQNFPSVFGSKSVD